jgi:hypothetical protein
MLGRSFGLDSPLIMAKKFYVGAFVGYSQNIPLVWQKSSTRGLCGYSQNTPLLAKKYYKKSSIEGIMRDP